MVKVPTYSSQETLRPTPMNPEAAATLGNEIIDVSKGIGALGEQIQNLDNRRQTLRAETYLAQRHREHAQTVATDPDIDSLDQRIANGTDQDIQTASNIIQSPEARSNFVERAQLDTERRNAPLYRQILQRKSQDFKNQLVQANDADVKEYMTLSDPDERSLLRQKIMDRTQMAIKDGHVNPEWAKVHVDTLLKGADINQVKDDMALNPTAVYEQLQKGKDGMYPYLSEKQRKQFADRAQKTIQKEGSDNKLIYSIAQNNAEEQLVNKMNKGQLTQADIGQAQLMGINGIHPRADFIKAAQDAINDPFPTESVPEKYNKLVESIQDPKMDPMTLKLMVLQSRGLTPPEKAHLITAHLREDTDNDGGKQSIHTLIQQGIKQNKEALMQADKRLKTEIQSRASFLSKITERFRDHAKDDAHLSQLQQDYYSKLQNVRDDKERLDLAQEIMNRDTLKRNPGIATANAKGTIFIDKTTGAKRRYYPSGFWEPVKTDSSQ